jgi:hypothetical protein
MSASPTVSGTSGSVYAGGAFWERLWRSAGIQSAALFIVAAFLYGQQPHAGASADDLTAFYLGERGRILIAAFVFGLATLNLLWFAAAIRATLAAEGKDGWGSAATAASAAFGALFLLFVTVVAALSYSIAGAGDAALASGLNDFAWVCFVLTSFPRAMLIMSGSFGFWRAGLISNATFTVCVAGVVLVLLGGTTWASDGFWAPGGVFSRLLSPAIGLVWVVLVSAFLLRRPAAPTGW